MKHVVAKVKKAKKGVKDVCFLAFYFSFHTHVVQDEASLKQAERTIVDSEKKIKTEKRKLEEYEIQLEQEEIKLEEITDSLKGPSPLFF